MKAKNFSKNLIPIPIVDETPVTIFNLTIKCKTCAYHTECTEDDMTIAYYNENKVPHRCHEGRGGIACVGAVESFNRLGLEIRQ